MYTTTYKVEELSHVRGYHCCGTYACNAYNPSLLNKDRKALNTCMDHSVAHVPGVGIWLCCNGQVLVVPEEWDGNTTDAKGIKPIAEVECVIVGVLLVPEPEGALFTASGQGQTRVSGEDTDFSADCGHYYLSTPFPFPKPEHYT